MKRIAPLPIIVLLVSILLAAGAEAVPERLNVVYTDWFPYTYSENGRASGFELEIFQAVTDEMGIRAEYARYPWKRCLLHLKTGKADALVSLIKTPDRAIFTHFPEAHISLSQIVFFTKTDTAIHFRGDLRTLKKLNIGVILGFSYGEVFDHTDFLNKDPSLDTKTLIKKLLAGRHDLAAENQSVILGYAQKMGVTDRIRIIDPPIRTEKLYVGFSKKNDLGSLADDFSMALDRFKATAAYRSILDKYGVAASQLESTQSAE